ncbi:uncharacterized protein ASPGLDRAFT_35115 [Aspergillus glaucus CBS 516.65]|uniref:Uncharacterized protein n=1 Tax=Aspergillus glaucus CBS 516.65 TaxID=1160497 RepID=A0A1L9VL16_ASPGL|nr:hypothetical protein ASPGLDRAFT_35115 [Aspergillus glaucus CBS 516.65]OJJ84628.1 hypothetical protein ASPGLDRAFT_35115 [Aspergillus glaucus CBS 516.65]
MRKSFLFNVSYNDDDALKQFGEDKKLAENLRDIYVGEDLTFPDNFKTNEFVRVRAPADTAVGDLESVVVPDGLNVDIKDLEL